MYFYCLFTLSFISVIYWAAGGLGTCKILDDDADTKCLDDGSCKKIFMDGKDYLCYTYIYPILDWGNHPGFACITIVVVAAALPLVHLFWLGVYKLRMCIYQTTCGKRARQVWNKQFVYFNVSIYRISQNISSPFPTSYYVVAHALKS